MNIPPNGVGLGVREDGSFAVLPHLEPREHQQADSVHDDDDDLRSQLDALKAQLAAKELELSEEKERARRAAHKRGFSKKIHELVDVDPETDLAGEFSGCVLLAD